MVWKYLPERRQTVRGSADDDQGNGLQSKESVLEIIFEESEQLSKVKICELLRKNMISIFFCW